MAYTTGSITSGTASEMFPNFGAESGTGVTSDSAYAKLLSLFKKFVCGEASEATAGANTGNGLVLHVEPTKDVTTKSWTLTFSSATAFAITASGETTVNGTLTGVAPNRKAVISAARFTLTVYEGSTPFTSGDTFTFSTTASGLNAGETWDVMADTAKGTAPASYYADLYTKTLNGTTTNRGTISAVRYYSQGIINTSYYVTFTSSTAFQVRPVSSPATILGSGTVGIMLEIPGVMDITVTAGSTGFTTTTYTGSTPSGGNYFLIEPKLTAAGTGSNLSRVIVFRHRGFDGSYNIYQTIAQRVGNNKNRFFLEGYCHSDYDSNVAMLSQQNISPAWRIKNKNPENAETVLYYIIADAMCAKILTLPHIDDPQGCYFGMYESHGTPSENTFPVLVGGSVAQNNTTIELNAAGSLTTSCAFFFSTSGMSYMFPPGGSSGSSWVEHQGDGDGVASSAAGNATTALGGFYSLPWDRMLTSAAGTRIHSGVYGEAGTKKAVLHSTLVVSKDDVSGVAGEYHGVYYIDTNATVNDAVVRGDTITYLGDTYLVWECSNYSELTSAAFKL